MIRTSHSWQVILAALLVAACSRATSSAASQASTPQAGANPPAGTIATHRRVVLGSMVGREVDEIRRQLRATLIKHGYTVLQAAELHSAADSTGTVVIDMSEAASSTDDRSPTRATSSCAGRARSNCTTSASTSNVTLSITADVSVTEPGTTRQPLHRSFTRTSTGMASYESSGAGLTYSSTSSSDPMMMNVTGTLADDIRKWIDTARQD